MKGKNTLDRMLAYNIRRRKTVVANLRKGIISEREAWSETTISTIDREILLALKKDEEERKRYKRKKLTQKQ